MAQTWFHSRTFPISVMLGAVLLAVVGPSLVSSHQTEGSTHFRAVSVSSLLVTDTFPSRSRLECVRQCEASSTCSGLCYSSSASVCYLSETASLSAPVSLDGEGDASLTCYFSGHCPADQGYAVYASRCVHMHSDRQKYVTATSTCSTKGGHVYHFKSKEWDSPALKELYKVVGGSGGIWVGADQLESAGKFRWRADGTSLSAEDPVWYVGQPDLSGGRDCAALLSSAVLVAYPCISQLDVICQIDV